MVCAPVRSIISPYRRTNRALSLTCTTIISVDLAHYGVSRAKDWVSVDCGTKTFNRLISQMTRHRFELTKCIIE